MARRNRAELGFDALRLEGALFSSDLLARVAHGRDDKTQREADYGIPKGLTVRDEIGRAFRIGQALWSEFDAERQRADRATSAAPRFVAALLRDAFGFTDLADVAAVDVEGRRFPVGHLAGRVPVVLAPHTLALDDPDERFADARRRSAFQLAQEYVNAAPDALWGLASNGLRLRLLRDAATLTRPAYLEADLERILSEDRYADFAALWLIIHRSRFGVGEARADDCFLERWRKVAREEGERARGDLRKGVTEALLALGEGFVRHADNEALRARLQSGELTAEAYFQQLLRLVYRLIFLFTAEDRGLLHPPSADPAAVALYGDGYAGRALRDRALRRVGFDAHHDLWQSLTVVWRALGQGESRLALPALGGLYAADQCPDLDAAELANRVLLTTMRHLAWFRQGAALARVNYRDMGPEELGSVYESLLELVPRVEVQERRFGFVGLTEAGSTKGHARKLTGSYYTPDSLVQQLIKTALDPVIQARLEGHPDDPVAALLSITVLDPACGSAHFLLAAARRLADALAKARHPDGNPSPVDWRHALRDVVAHCIFGVDRNPMALELARTALWLEAHSADAPLTFIDHHLVCGDALLGLMDFSVMKRGIPDDAFKPLTGDDREACRTLAKANRAATKQLERDGGRQLTLDLGVADLARALDELDGAGDDSLAAIDSKRARWASFARDVGDGRLAKAADLYMVAFLAPKPKGSDATVPTGADVLLQLAGTGAPAAKLAVARVVCRDARVLHWPLAFAQVFARGGFDVVLGNPPWEVSQLSEEEFFATRDSSIASLAGTKRKAAITGLERENPALWRDYVRAKFTLEASNTFFRADRRFQLTAVGKLNTYALFAETFYRIIGPDGRAGLIVPTGIATDDSTKSFFSEITTAGRLVSLLSFENEEFIFPSVHHAYRFSLVTLCGPGVKSEGAIFSFFLRRPANLVDPERQSRLSSEDLALINPNTRTCAVFRSRADADLTKRIYSNVPVLWKEAVADAHGTVVEPEANPWGLSFRQGLFNMTSDSALFRDAPAADRLPLYEAKLIHQFDHRWATYVASANGDESNARDLTDAEKADPDLAVRPRYWVEERQVLARMAAVPRELAKAYAEDDEKQAVRLLAAWIAGSALHSGASPELAWRKVRDVAAWLPSVPRDAGLQALGRQMSEAAGPPGEALFAAVATERSGSGGLRSVFDATSPRWLMGWRDITGVEKIRTVIASVVPRAGVGHTVPLVTSAQARASSLVCLLGFLNAMCLDYVARTKVGGTHLTFGYLKQLPVPTPPSYSTRDLLFLVPRILELTYTAHDVRAFYEGVVAVDSAYDPRTSAERGRPFAWDPLRRAELRAELDAYYARLYGLTRDELRYILDPKDVMGEDYPSETFRVLCDSEIRDFGEYRTRRLVLEAWDRLPTGGTKG